MTVAELIKKLRTYPKDATVAVEVQADYSWDAVGTAKSVRQESEELVIVSYQEMQ